MRCPFCQVLDTRVVDSRLVNDDSQIRRRRGCPACNERFTTYETVEWVLPQIIKRDMRRVAFDKNKLKTGIMKAIEKRPISADQVEDVLNQIIKKLHTCSEREISSRLLGEWVMEELKTLDPVAYVRFASVYKSFEGLDAFSNAIKGLEEFS